MAVVACNEELAERVREALQDRSRGSRPKLPD